MRILIATDAWRPQVNGVVHSLEQMSAAARQQGAFCEFLTPQGFATLPLPTYPDIRLALASRRAAAKRIEAIAPDHIHIATEGPIGLAARRYCRAVGRVFTTSYHTRFPEYIRARAPVPPGFTYALLRWFHSAASAVMAPTPTIRDELTTRGFAGVKVWSRGVDHELFRPCLGGSFSMSAALRWRRTLPHCSISTCRARRSSSATAPPERPCSATIHERISSARARAKSSPRFTPAPMSSSFRAAPIRSASC